MRLAMSSPLPIPLSSSTIAQTNHHRFSAAPPQLSQQPPCATSQDTDQKSPPKAKTIRFRLSQLCQQGQINLARQLFDAIPKPTTVLWNTLIIGYVCNNMPHEAISLYSRLFYTINSEDGKKCDDYTYSSVLKACADTKQLLVGKAVHCHVLRSDVYPSKIVYNSLFNMYTACALSSGCGLVNKVFDNMRKRNVVSWNTMISWCTKTGRCVEAIGRFSMMMRAGFTPSVVSFVNVFPAISGVGDVGVANVVYGMVTKLGDEYVNDLFVVSSAITMYAELGCLDFARKIFDKGVTKNAHVWNTMIGGYVQNNCPVSALELFSTALEVEDSGNLDDVTFLSALNAASDLQQLDVARQLHSYLIKNSLLSSVILLNAVIALYSRCNSIGDSFKVFTEMRERDVVTWNSMICGLVQNGLDDEGVMLVYEMQKLGFSIDDVTITAILSAASNLRNREIGKQTHGYLIRHGIRFTGMESYLIDMYAKSGLIEDAETIFKTNCKGSKDLALWNAMISGTTQMGLIEKSLIIFQQMLVENVVPNAVTLSSILPACSQLGSIAIGKQLHAIAVRNFLDVNIFVISALVDMYSKSGSLVYAERVFTKSGDRNSVTYTNMILGYAQHGMGEKAVALFHSMKEYDITPDSTTIVAVLSACSYTGLIDEGIEIYEEMESKYGIKPSTEHYACIVDMLGRVGRVVEAYNFARDLGKEGDVLGIWGAILSACRVHREFELGKVVAEKMSEIEGGGGVTAGYRVLLSNIHAEEGNWDDVKTVRKDMAERGVVKEVGCSWIDVSGNVNCFVSRERRHSKCGEIYRLLERLNGNLKDTGYTPSFLGSDG